MKAKFRRRLARTERFYLTAGTKQAHLTVSLKQGRWAGTHHTRQGL
jgi:hypothetical protein